MLAAVTAMTIGGQATSAPGYGLTGERLAVTVLTTAVAVVLAAMIVLRLRPAVLPRG